MCLQRSQVVSSAGKEASNRVEELLLDFEDLCPAGDRENEHSANERDGDAGVVTSYGEIDEVPALGPGVKSRA